MIAALILFSGIDSQAVPASTSPAKTSAADTKPAKSSGTASRKPGGQAKTAAASQAQKTLDRNEVLSLYLSGEFETLVALLENIRRERQLRDREDSIFIYKFLGVIYGANEGTRRKAESFLYQMLKLDPKEDLSALGVGDSVESIFDRVRVRFGKAREDSLALRGIKPMPAMQMAVPATGTNTQPPATPAPAATATATQSSRPVPAWVWYAGGGVAVAALASTLVLINQQPDAHVHTINDTIR